MKLGGFRFLLLGLLGIVVGFTGYWQGNLLFGVLGTLAVIVATVDLLRRR